jgi:hypothetical protein
MKLTGSELRIQAQFLELKADDERLTPNFVAFWTQAKIKAERRRPSLRFSYAGVGFVILASFSLVLWSRTWQKQELVVLESPLPPSYLLPTVANVIQADEPSRPFRPLPRKHRPAHRRSQLPMQQAVINNASAFAVWQSPTSKLLESPAEDVLSTLPQLTQASLELQSFLPAADVKENK